MRGTGYQLSLILLGVIVSVMLAGFFYRELYPEYKIYQNAYQQLEEFLSKQTGEPPPPFEKGVKQIVIEQPDKGPPVIDRCTSCHVTLQFSHFSPDNKNYVFRLLDEKIAELEKTRPWEAAPLKRLKEHQMEKVLIAHPLIGKETRPFEYHPIEEYGCTSCHNGNGRALTTEKAHGPVYDGDYEPEYMGPKPEFLEKDPKNDPEFSRVFNDKPGHSLLFQTTPIYVGGLIEAKCVQCHNKTPITGVDKVSEEVDRLLTTYTQGQELYFSQACYACHRISGLARGGVGPELTNEGDAYPWFVKESIVWPQADLKTSTMPNFHLDHEELEDLVTFLLGQKGRPQSISEVTWKTAISDWDAGKKLDYEKPINPVKLRDVNYGMTVFATEGCAACHRLKGFESTLGFKNPKDADWFTQTIPEEIFGNDLVQAIKKHQHELNQKIVKVKDTALLDQLEADNPGLLESFYSNFKFALRANDSPEWEKTVRKVLMMYIREYGLGRLIGPRPNWSGVYRTDEWLISHFRKPTSHIPYSIMPVFPFDDTKFYALTYMLNVLGQKNRDALKKKWKEEGFDPKEAYQTLCSQCHGEYLHGNGPVAKWIYPIPKNLRNAEFLKNYTKENVVYSLVHGIKGTPMPPWGEVASDKPFKNVEPVLSRDEIDQLVNWIFGSLLGGESIRDITDVPKWQYGPDDVIQELKGEKDELKPGPQPETLHLYEMEPEKGAFLFETPRDYLVSLQPMPTSNAAEIFDIEKNPEPGSDSNLYFIKKKYYTKENLQAAENFFELNCAVCHGKEADGMGFRAGTMYDAKPRMLTNLHWIEMRDDMRLLRSLKYGVPGTSMTPWGDQTTSLQRLQLVMYIRSLSLEQKQRDALTKKLYDIFDQGEQAIELARSKEFVAIDTHQKELAQVMRQRENAPANEVVALFEKETALKEKIKNEKKQDDRLLELKKLLALEEEEYNMIGVQLIRMNLRSDELSLFMQILDENKNRYQFENDQLKSLFPDVKKITVLKDKLLEKLDQSISEKKQQKVILEGKLASKERNDQLEAVTTQINDLTKLKDQITQGFNEITHLREKQHDRIQ